MNSINLIGRVGVIPTSVSFTDTGNKVAKFTLAVYDYSSKSDNKEPMWVQVEAWNNLADRVLKYITQGREIGINGRLAISKYEREKPTGEAHELRPSSQKARGRTRHGRSKRVCDQEKAQDCGIAGLMEVGRKPCLLVAQAVGRGFSPDANMAKDKVQSFL